MFAVISKKDYWGYLDSGAAQPDSGRLKDIQDAFVLYELLGQTGKSILEVGGGHSRILPVLAKKKNTCWNVDNFEGQGRGPLSARWNPKIKVVKDYVGNFSRHIPDNSFDYIVSVSVVEHISTDFFPDFVRDCHRILKVGGVMLHAIDVYLFDEGADHPFVDQTCERLKLYRSTPDIVDGAFEWIAPPEIGEDIHAKASYAINSCKELYQWNRSVPELKPIREIAVSCSLRLGLRKVR